MRRVASHCLYAAERERVATGRDRQHPARKPHFTRSTHKAGQREREEERLPNPCSVERGGGRINIVANNACELAAEESVCNSRRWLVMKSCCAEP